MSREMTNALNEIQKKFGIDVRSIREQCKEDRIFLDSPSMNFVLGGGFVPGRFYILSGPESGGKTSIATYIASQVQRKYESHRYVVYADFEYSLNMTHAEELGLELDDHLIFMRPKCGEDFFDALVPILETGEVGLVVIDSLTDMASKAQTEDAFSGFSGGKTAAMLSYGLKKIAPYLYNNKCAMLMIAQERANIGATYGADFKIATSKAPLFKSSFTARVTKTEEITDPTTKEMVGIRIRVRNTKNKLGIPKRDANLKLMFNGGVDSEEEYLEYLTTFGIIKKSGAMYEVEGDAWGMGKVRGKDAVKTFLLEHPDIYNKVKEQVNNMIVGHTKLDEVEHDFSDLSTDYLDIKAPIVSSEDDYTEEQLEAMYNGGLDVTDEN